LEDPGIGFQGDPDEECAGVTEKSNGKAVGNGFWNCGRHPEENYSAGTSKGTEELQQVRTLRAHVCGQTFSEQRSTR